MKSSLQESGNRREFLRNGARLIFLGTAAAIVAEIVRERRVLLPAENCINRSICSGCAVFEKCELPAALTVKRVTNGGRS